MSTTDKYWLTLQCDHQRPQDKKNGDFEFQAAKGFETPIGINHILFEACEELIKDALIHSNNGEHRINLVKYLRNKGYLRD